MVVSTFMVYGLAFLMASFVLLPTNERASGAKHLQYLAGLRPEVYWTANFAADFIVCNAQEKSTSIFDAACAAPRSQGNQSWAPPFHSPYTPTITRILRHWLG